MGLIVGFAFVVLLGYIFYSVINYTSKIDESEEPYDESDEIRKVFKDHYIKSKQQQYADRVRDLKIIEYFVPCATFQDRPVYKYLVVKSETDGYMGYIFDGVFEKSTRMTPTENEILIKGGLVYKRVGNLSDDLVDHFESKLINTDK